MESGARPSLRAAADRGLAVSWHATRAPDRFALRSERGDRTYAQLDGRANGLARALRRAGLQAGDAVALVCGNRPEFVEVFCATQRTGLRLTPVNRHLTGEEVAYIVRDCGARVVVVESALAPVAAAVREAAPAAAAWSIDGALDGWSDYDAVLAAESADPIDDPRLGRTMLYTSGTTGRPKGVLRLDQPTAHTELELAKVYRGDSVHLCTGPLYHAAPLQLSLNVPLHGGATVVLMDRFDAREALALVERFGVTHTHMVPTMFHRLLALPDDVRGTHDTSSLVAVIHGAAPCPVATKREMIAWLGPVLYEYYAATEGSGTVVDSHRWLERPGTVGRPEPREQVMVGDDAAVPLPAGEVGLVWLRSPDGGGFEYFGDSEKTASAHRGAYFTLGDLGYLDADGYLFLTDRSANLIISGGVNVYPAEVDAVLLQHDAVGDVATIGVPDPEWGERVLAVVEPRAGVVPTDALARELVEFCRARLAHYKCPRGVDFVETLPRQENGKIYKRLLRDRYREAARD